MVLDRVVGPGLGVEQVDDHVAVVQEDPVAQVVTLNTQPPVAHSVSKTRSISSLIACNCRRLVPLARTKKSNTRQLADVEDDDIAAAVLLRRPRGARHGPLESGTDGTHGGSRSMYRSFLALPLSPNHDRDFSTTILIVNVAARQCKRRRGRIPAIVRGESPVGWAPPTTCNVLWWVVSPCEVVVGGARPTSHALKTRRPGRRFAWRVEFVKRGQKESVPPTVSENPHGRLDRAGGVAPNFEFLPIAERRWAEPTPRQAGRALFLPRDDTSGCTKEAHGFRDRKAEIDRRGRSSSASPGRRGQSRAIPRQAWAELPSWPTWTTTWPRPTAHGGRRPGTARSRWASSVERSWIDPQGWSARCGRKST